MGSPSQISFSRGAGSTIVGQTPSHSFNNRGTYFHLADKVASYERNRMQKTIQVETSVASNRRFLAQNVSFRDTLEKIKHNLFSREASVVEIDD